MKISPTWDNIVGHSRCENLCSIRVFAIRCPTQKRIGYGGLIISIVNSTSHFCRFRSSGRGRLRGAALNFCMSNWMVVFQMIEEIWRVRVLSFNICVAKITLNLILVIWIWYTEESPYRRPATCRCQRSTHNFTCRAAAVHLISDIYYVITTLSHGKIRPAITRKFLFLSNFDSEQSTINNSNSTLPQSHRQSCCSYTVIPMLNWTIHKT